MDANESSREKPLQGIRVLEMGQLIAGPFAGQMLAYFGADVVKIEPPGKGDPLRTWRLLDDAGTSYWWSSIARNKKSMTLDLACDAGQEIARQLINQADVLVENFRAGKMESWGLGPDGANLSLGDTFAGLHAVIGVLLALMNRQSDNGRGQVVDVSIVESIFNMMEGVVSEYDGTGMVREPSGTTVTGIVPTNTYACADNKFIVIGGNGDSIFKRLMNAIGRQDMASDERLTDNAGRVVHEGEIDTALNQWASSVNSADALAVLNAAAVPAGPINSIADVVADPHFQSRNSFEPVNVDGEQRVVPAMHPKLERTPGSTQWPGPKLGEHTKTVLIDWLDADEKTIRELTTSGVI